MNNAPISRYKLAPLKAKAKREGWSRFIRSEVDERAVLAGYTFSQRKADHVDLFFRTFLKHSKGDLGGKPFEFLDWQRDGVMHPLFGWIRPDGRRRFTRSYVEIPKKNGKSTLASGVAVYLTVADGEQGAEVYCAATAKEQARIVWGEAANMVEASPELCEVLTVNRSIGNILFPATNSFLRVLASEAGANEGWNAHGIIVDELHKWHGRALWDALKWAFAARRQPLLFVITTAGDDMLSVCREQHDYAQGVIDGDIPDLHFLPYIRSADEDDDWLDPKTWHKANPSLGVAIPLDRFKEDLEEAAKTPTSQASFRRYRLNVWNTGESRWLKRESWKACKRTISAADLKGKPCYAGLDLAKVRDTTGLGLVFDMGDHIAVKAHFWLPKDTALEMRDTVPYELWEEMGLVTLTDGATCDYAVVERDILKFHAEFKILELGFDKIYAEDITQRLDSNGIPRWEVPQSKMHLTGPTTELERLILKQAIVHDGNPMLAWQVGNAQVRTDINNNQQLSKPTPDDPRKIDGVAAIVNALHCWLAHQPGRQGNAYTAENPGVILL